MPAMPATSPGLRARAWRIAPRVAPPLVLVIVLTSLVVNSAEPLTNTDTYFHLRFGHAFLDGWSVRHPGSVSTFANRPWVPTQWLSEIVMASTEEWFGLSGLAWLSGLMELALFATVYARHALGPLRSSRFADRARALRDAGRAVDATAGVQLPAHRPGHRGVAAHPRRRPRPVVAGRRHLAVGDAARDVAGRAGDRHRGGRRTRPRPRPAPTRAARGGGDRSRPRSPPR